MKDFLQIQPAPEDELGEGDNVCPTCGHNGHRNSSGLLRCDNCGYEEDDEALEEEEDDDEDEESDGCGGTDY